MVKTLVACSVVVTVLAVGARTASATHPYGCRSEGATTSQGDYREFDGAVWGFAARPVFGYAVRSEQYVDIACSIRVNSVVRARTDTVAGWGVVSHIGRVKFVAHITEAVELCAHSNGESHCLPFDWRQIASPGQ